MVMKKKGIVAVLMVMVMCVLSACGTKFDAKGYVDACLDVQFKGEYDQYMKMTKASKEEAQKLYKDGVDSFMKGYEQLSLPEELNNKFREAYKKMLKSAKYTVKEAKETDNGFKVSVTVKPMKCFENYDADLKEMQEKFLKDFQEKFEKDGQIPSKAEIEKQMAEIIYKDLEERISNCEYGGEETFDVSVKKENDKTYTADEADLGEIAQAALGV